ncbi:MAG TPA: HD domain-containing phosphohydrolase [Gemmataceae bacterium]|jgi:HD-GYP domain-containing protein (c-di-GMP phosphodiesterase class II)|nr:HD domain-containing phosphohydrolase [Gemmataceae bacterium]
MGDRKEILDILKKIAALRERLRQAQTQFAGAKVSAAAGAQDAEAAPTAVLEEKVHAGTWHNTLIDGALWQASGAAGAEPPLPVKLTARAAQVLKGGRQLLHQLREMLEDPLLRASDQDPLTSLHVEIASMLDILLRTVQAFPPSASTQLRLCAGLEAGQRVIEERLMVLNAALTHRRREIGRLDSLAETFRKLASGQTINPQTILALAEEIAQEARNQAPLRFLHAAPEDPARFVAAHSITVAQVMARLLHDDTEWKDRLEEALFAALLHDVGMVRVPAEILAQPGPLTDDQRRLVERHPSVGAHMISRIMPGGGICVEGATDHHERLDGTGYPAGRRDLQLSTFTRILAICDIYAALAARRPYRPAQDTRTALTDTLLLADQGTLDRTHAEKLLGLSFYPVGSVVELNDGAAGYVMATLPGRQGVDNPGKPIVSLFTGPGGQVLAVPRLVHLLADGRSIVRSLPTGERRKLLLGKYPEFI